MQLPIGVSERWIILGDVTNSTYFLNLLDSKLEGNVKFATIGRYEDGIERMYLQIQKVIGSTASTAILGNTMGDGFLVLGMHGHGVPHIQWEFPRVLLACNELKKTLDGILDETIKEIYNLTRNNIRLPSLKIRICVNQGLIATSLALNRFVGDCINYTARLLSCWNDIVEDDEKVFLLTKGYFDLLPVDLKEKARQAKFEKIINVGNYPEKNQITREVIYKIFIESNETQVIEFWRLVKKYINKLDFVRDMGKLAADLYRTNLE